MDTNTRVDRRSLRGVICDRWERLSFAGILVLTLLFVPALYAAWFGVRAPQAGAKRGELQLTPVASPSS